MAIDSKNIDDFINVMTKAFDPKKPAAIEAMVRDIMAEVTTKHRAQRERIQCKNLKAIDKMLGQLSRQTGGSSRTSSKNSKTTSTPASGTT